MRFFAYVTSTCDRFGVATLPALCLRRWELKVWFNRFPHKEQGGVGFPGGVSLLCCSYLDSGTSGVLDVCCDTGNPADTVSSLVGVEQVQGHWQLVH